VRGSVLAGLGLLVASLGLTSLVSAPWQLMATWGVLVGLGCGVIAMPLGMLVANRWFVARRGLVTGLLGGSVAAGQLVLLPPLAAIAATTSWRWVTIALAIAAAAMIPLAAWLVRDRPSDVGLLPYGATREEMAAERPPSSIGDSFRALLDAMRKRDFWLLQSTFFVCGLSTSGLIATHLVAYCFDMGVSEVTAAGLLGTMGVFNLIGTMASGWLTDRYDPRWLLFWYFLLRGLSLLFLPFSGFSIYTLTIFMVFYGLDWIATLPPTVKLLNGTVGVHRGPAVFAWMLVGHQVGSGLAAFGGGLMRVALESYIQTFLISGTACLLAALAALAIQRGLKPRTPALAPAA